jgi:hypothetical protein
MKTFDGVGFIGMGKMFELEKVCSMDSINQILKATGVVILCDLDSEPLTVFKTVLKDRGC